MARITLTMIAKNEEKWIGRALDSVRPFVEDMIVVDTGSEDRTAAIASQKGAKVLHIPWTDDFSAARNAALEAATGEWALVLDADERLEAGGGDQLRAFAEQQDPMQIIGRVRVRSRFLQGGSEQTVEVGISRLFGSHLRYTGRIHEQLPGHLPRLTCGFTILHDGYFETNKSGRNIALLQKELQDRPEDAFLLFQLGKEYKRAGQTQAAEHWMSMGYERRAQSPLYLDDAVVDYLYVLLENRSLTQAIQVLQESDSALAYLADYHFVRGLVYMEAAIALPQQAAAYLPQIEASYQTCLYIGQQAASSEIVRGASTYLAAYNLGLFYELMGLKQKAAEQYDYAGRWGYAPAMYRLERL